MNTNTIRNFSLACMLSLVAPLEVAAQRLAVPEYVTCDRNQLTSWQGEITRVTRQGNGIDLAIATDYGTSESLTMTGASWEEVLAQFRLAGRPFRADDWDRLFDTEGNHQPGLRAIVWLCQAADQQPIVNWQLPGR
ncbi:hypothetical protein KUV22_09740 [Microbulbifer agarilyticus]|uniref:hypothetical protein n=1 Tax=Microbulbifer agarilyticus TaxID=260552 RepID=UPI001C9504C4|nr:hypothetical protein [Microbulbifer agarilyticus]MBY6190695.1 hypothetical protein [Microbulbifer agarilyticus]